ncbi:AT-hook motif nuclear-localized protein 7-like [Cannabis sativa]|uniref:AT-hook motif nuclear-localized protein 7-like n=1 Tax=Cannabis sativa TaxID=3483 RepID=UPI0029CA4E0C|nr:AT-hook motif nuclear-localized protein 7-like [Cannabis sativa]
MDTPPNNNGTSSSNNSYGNNFTTHKITVTEGQDVVSIMKDFAMNYEPNSLLTVFSANGSTSLVDIINCGDYNQINRYEGVFRIMSVSWTVELDSNHSPENYGMSTSLKVLLNNLDTGKAFGGIAEQLVAATPIKISVGSFKRRD